MAVFLVSFTVAGNNRQALESAIQSYGQWWHQGSSVWLIETYNNSNQVATHLNGFLRPSDKLLVIEVSGNWWAVGHTQEEYDWMRSKRLY